MVARSLPPQPALLGKAAPPLHHPRRRTRTPLLHPAPSSNPVAEVLEEALELGMLAGDAGPLPHTRLPTSRRRRDLSVGRRTPTPGRENRRFCAGFLLSWGFEEDGRGHGHVGGVSFRPHGEALHGSKSRRGEARWCGAGGHRELQPSHLHAHACSSLQRSCSSEGSRCWVDAGYMSPVNDANKKKAMQKGHQRTLTILSRVKNSLCKDGLADQGSVKVMLLCGSDLLESFSKPGVWIPDQVQNLEHFLVPKGDGSNKSESKSQRKKSNLKKCSEESQLRVAGWFRGRGRRRRRGRVGVCAAAWVRVPGRARRRGCRGRLYVRGT